MKRSLLAIISITITLFFSIQSQALVEARVTYGLLASRPDLAALYGGAGTVPSIVPNYGIGLDALVIIPVVGLGAGLRYENLGFTATSGSLTYKSTATRTALLVNYRIIDTLMYFGPIFSYGLSHTNEISVNDTTLSYQWAPDSSSSYQAGLEIGSKIGGILLGAEAGYQSMNWKKMTDKAGTSTSTPDTDMSGTYAKIILGFGI